MSLHYFCTPTTNPTILNGLGWCSQEGRGDHVRQQSCESLAGWGPENSWSHSALSSISFINTHSELLQRVKRYYLTCPRSKPFMPMDPYVSSSIPTLDSVMSNFDQFHFWGVTQDNKEGWVSELWCYLKDISAEVKKDMFIVGGGRYVVHQSNNHKLKLTSPTGSFSEFTYILHSPKISLTSAHSRHIWFLVSAFSLQVSRILMIEGLPWVLSSLRSYKWRSLHGRGIWSM